MATEQDFLQAIRENPQDETLKYVFADWLDEQGDPRGELIRVCLMWRKFWDQNAETEPELKSFARQLGMEEGYLVQIPAETLKSVGVNHYPLQIEFGPDGFPLPSYGVTPTPDTPTLFLISHMFSRKSVQALEHLEADIAEIIEEERPSPNLAGIPEELIDPEAGWIIVRENAEPLFLTEEERRALAEEDTDTDIHLSWWGSDSDIFLIDNAAGDSDIPLPSLDEDLEDDLPPIA